MEQNRAALIGQGFYYPATNRLPHPNLPKHTSLYVALMNGPDAVRAEREILLGEFEASGCTTMVLSEEGMSSPGFLRERAMERVQILAPDFDIRIISFLRRQDELGNAQIRKPLHLGQALQDGGARVRRLATVLFTGDVAGRQSGVGMGRADEAVAVGFERLRHALSPFISPIIERTPSASKLATG